MATATPLDYFLLLFPISLWEEIVNSTNEYAEWCFQTKPDPSWTPTFLRELLVTIGLKLIMGTNNKASRRDYWSSSEFVGQRGFQRTMSCGRFEKIQQYFHVNDRQTELPRSDPNYNRLCKIQPVIDALNINFRRYYRLSPYVSIDESMIAFSGRLSFKQFIPNKPIRRGIKLWARACAVTGYLDRFEVYLGRQEGGYVFGLGHFVVTRLTDDLHNSYRQIYMDNFFTSVKLAIDLLKRGLYCCGTMRPQRRGFPAELMQSRLTRGQSAVKQRGNLMALVWKDRRNIAFISTCSQPDEFGRCERRTPQGIIEIQRPQLVEQYNGHMGGVDLNDQIRETYGLGYHNKKWWVTMFNTLLNIAVTNAFILYRESSTRPTPNTRYRHIDFRRELAQQLINGYQQRRRRFHPTPTSKGRADEHRFCHMPARLRCKLHAFNGHRRDTVYGCMRCGLNLCSTCYDVVHADIVLMRRLIHIYGFVPGSPISESGRKNRQRPTQEE